MSEEELNEVIEYNLEYMDAMQSEEIFGGDYTSSVELKYANKSIDRLQQENNRLKSEKIGLERLCNHNYLVAEDLEKEKQDLIKWLESKNQFHYKNGKIEDNYILVSEVLNKVRGDR